MAAKSQELYNAGRSALLTHRNTPALGLTVLQYCPYYRTITNVRRPPSL